LIHDKFGQGFNIVFLLMAIFAVMGSAKYPQFDHENKSEYFSLILMAVVGMMFLAKSGNMITAFVSLEIFSISCISFAVFQLNMGQERKVHQAPLT